MKRLVLFILFAFAAAVQAQQPVMPKSWEEPLPSGAMSDDYPLTADSQRNDGVPVGKILNFPFEGSKIFPNTKRNISVYVPAQYKADKPACVYAALDGLGFNAPVVFDNLIHKGELPVIIGIGTSSGDVPSATGENPRHNRSFEFDGLSDNLGRFLIEEIFPFVEQQKTPDGLPIKLSKDPNDRCTGGGSTGGIGAFTLAWERPDQFRRVFSAIGTFVCMRGGDRYPVLVRKTEPKPLRIFLQDSSHDQWLGGPEVGDWWISNVAVNRALEFSGYDVKHAWGTGPHSGAQAAQVFPDAMRFLWKDYPNPVKAQTDKTLNVFLKQILKPEQDWVPVAELQPKLNQRLAVDKDGNITCEDINVIKDTLPNGNYYTVDSDKGTLYLVKKDSTKIQQGENLKRPGGVAITPDGLWLAVIESGSHFGTSYQIKSDDTLEAGQRYYWFHVPDEDDELGTGDCCFDEHGRLYVATRFGVSVLDRNGRTRAILPSPVRGGQASVSSVRFGGKNFDELYIITDDKVFKRQMNIKGSPVFRGKVKLPNWGAG
ncbi:MAG: SMP-30/gluconolactonase/LRE family protein [Planctomycetaceae bacterium]|nr:SMP-30/gluconolactonase/LRE family protein [Planctomycetaceae bacterium]